jgi:hypothetical protein
MRNSFTMVMSALVLAAGSIGTAYAHHSFAPYDLAQRKLVEGHVKEWNYNNPHSWLIIEAPDANGEMKTWSFEGAAIVHAARQGVNGTTYRKGEQVKVVMHPMRDGRLAGAHCIVVKEDGSFTRPNDGICDSEAVFAEWQQNGWIANGKHLEAHAVPAAATAPK